MDNQKNQPQIPINIDPQDYHLGNATIVFDEEQFYFVLQSGLLQRRYILSPKHAKRFALLLDAKVKEYEKAFGKLATALANIEAGKPETSETKSLGFGN